MIMTVSTHVRLIKLTGNTWACNITTLKFHQNLSYVSHGLYSPTILISFLVYFESSKLHKFFDRQSYKYSNSLSEIVLISHNSKIQ